MPSAPLPPPEASCPLPTADYPAVTLAHGGGGTLTDRLLHTALAPLLPPVGAPALRDAADVPLPQGTTAVFTTDTYVVDPPVFPGGTIGLLAVHGTLNDLAVAGAAPRALSVALVLQEGLPLDFLAKIAADIRAAADAASVPIVTGDTKVVERSPSATPTLYVNTAGVGARPLDRPPPAPERIVPGDAIVLTSPIAAHGIAVMGARMHLDFGPAARSDSANLAPALLAAYEAAPGEIHCARDATRSGLGGILCELATAAGMPFRCDEPAIPVAPFAAAACEVLGLDPLFVANEGCAALLVAPTAVEAVLAALRAHPATATARVIGHVDPPSLDAPAGQVALTTALGTTRVLTPPAGHQLPRIC